MYVFIECLLVFIVVPLTLAEEIGRLYSQKPLAYGPGRAVRFLPGHVLVLASPLNFGVKNDSSLEGLSFSLWMQVTDPTKVINIISIATDDTRMDVIGGDDFISVFGNTVAMFEALVPFSDPVVQTDGDWHHYLYTFNDTKMEVSCIVDGVLVGSVAYPNEHFINETDGYNKNLIIGTNQDGFYTGLNELETSPMLMDDMRIWRRTLGPEHAKMEMEGKLDETFVNEYLVAQWHFDEEIGSPVFNDSTNNPQYTLIRANFKESSLLDVVANGPPKYCNIPLQQPSSQANIFTKTPSVVLEYSQGTSLPITVIVSETDPEVITATMTLGPTSGQLLLNGSEPILVNAPMKFTAMETFSILNNLTYIQNNDLVEYVQDTFIISIQNNNVADINTQIVFHIIANSAPIISDATWKVNENSEASFTLLGDDPDHTLPRYNITTLPERGKLIDTGNGDEITQIHYTLLGPSFSFRPDPDSSNTVKYAEFHVIAHDGLVSSPPALQTIIVYPVNKLPKLDPSFGKNVNISIDEDSIIRFTIPFTDQDSTQPALQLKSIPSSSSGTLYVVSPNGTLTPITTVLTASLQISQDTKRIHATIIDASYNSTDCDETGFCPWSTNVLYYPQVDTFRNGAPVNDIYCWYPFKTINCTSADDSFFYSEWMHIRFNTPVSPTTLHNFFCAGGDYVVRVRALDNISKKWITLKSLYNPTRKSGSGVQTINLCQTIDTITDIMVDMDNCFYEGWKGMSYFQLEGNSVGPSATFGPNVTFEFHPSLNWNGRQSITYSLSDCLGDPFRSTDTYNIELFVKSINDPPTIIYIPPYVASNSIPNVILINSTDVDGFVSYVKIIDTPQWGNLWYQNKIITKGFIGPHPLALSYIPSDPYSCGERVPFDEFSYTVIDNEDASAYPNGKVTIKELKCEKCKAGSILIGNVCKPCSGGTEEVNGECKPLPPSKVPLIVSVVVGCTLGIAVIGILVWKWFQKVTEVNRAFKSAPGSSGCAVIMFTDIQGSTTLWENMEETMSKALDIHNNIVRRLISSHNAYEVKTQGDSFMIAVEDPNAAADLAMELQHSLLNVEWPPELYSDPLCTIANNNEGRLMWRGLRVRVGMHFGPVEREFDPNTRRIDYFGPTVNCAARVESLAHGGQILTTSNIAEYLDSRILFDCIGAYPLKGISLPLNIFQIIPPYLNDRVFPPPNTGASTKEEDSDHKGIQKCLRCTRPLKCSSCLKESKGSSLRAPHISSSSKASSMSMLSSRGAMSPSPVFPVSFNAHKHLEVTSP